ncbi:MAG: HNH endonuclease [Chloroflexi bacterium]|nr:HNH endonuclease [Chloroflexota bacterium]
MNIDETLFFETDGACAYCGIKDSRVLTIHHIEKCKLKDESYGNKIVLCHNCHVLHNQKKSPTNKEITAIKKRLIYKTLTQQGANALKEAYRKKCVLASPYLVNHIVEMQLLEEREIVMEIGEEDDINLEGTRVASLVTYELTPKGRQFVKKWGLA